MKEKNLIYTKDVAAILGIDARTVKSYVQRGLLSCIESNYRGRANVLLFSRDEVERLKVSLGDIPDLEEKVAALRKELHSEEVRLRKEIDEAKRSASSYKGMFSRTSMFVHVVIGVINTLANISDTPFSDRELDILKDIVAGATPSDIGKAYGISYERVRQVADKALRKLMRRVPEDVVNATIGKDNEIASLKETVRKLTDANDRLRLSATKKKGATPEVIGGLIYERPIRDLFLSVRADNVLRAVGVETIGELCSLREKDLKGMRGFGHVSLMDVTKQLGRLGLSLGTMPRAPRLSRLYRD